MNLILGTTPEANWDTVSVLFENAGWVELAENSEACYQIGEAQTTEGDRFLLLHSHPEEAIARTIANGAQPEQARDAWLTAAKAMINFYKRHRKQAVMVYTPSLLADPIAQLTSIAAQLGLPDHDSPTTTCQVEQAPLLERLMASQLLKQTPGIAALLASIEACTLPLAGHSFSAPALDFNAANLQLVTLRANLAESELLVIQLQQESLQNHAARQKAETADKAELKHTLAKQRRTEDANCKLEEDLVGLQQQHAAELVLQMEQQVEFRSQLAEVKLQLQQSQEERGLLMEQLHLVQEELEEKFLSHGKLQEKLVQIEAQRQADQQATQKAEKTLQQTEQKRSEVEAEYKEDLNQTLATLRSAEITNRKLEEKLAGQQKNHATELAGLKAQQKEKMLRHIKKTRREVEFEFKQDLKQTLATLRGAEKASRKLEEEMASQQKNHAAELADLKKQQTEKMLRLIKKTRREVEFEFKQDLKQTLATLRSAEKANRKLDSELAEYREQQDYALEAANHQIQRLQSELNGLKSSTAFKATAPVRALKTRLRGNLEEKSLKKQVELVRQSGLFNVGWYLKTYPDVAENGIDPILHYFKYGAEELRNPSPELDTDWYLTSNPDVAEAGMNPLLHYIKFGQQEGRSTSRHSHPSLPTLRAA